MQAGSSGRIGPNAILQLAFVLEGRLGAEQAHRIYADAGLVKLPDGDEMIPEQDAARLHQAVRRMEPARAQAMLRDAGERTADYILAHRIPKAAQIILKLLPQSFAARLLSRAIAQHAWTFVGSGVFRVVSPWCFEIARNPLIADEPSDTLLCAWHSAVFERLYRVLVTPDARCMETSCGAQGMGVCRFEIRPEATPASSSGSHHD